LSGCWKEFLDLMILRAPLFSFFPPRFSQQTKKEVMTGASNNVAEGHSCPFHLNFEPRRTFFFFSPFRSCFEEFFTREWDGARPSGNFLRAIAAGTFFFFLFSLPFPGESGRRRERGTELRTRGLGTIRPFPLPPPSFLGLPARPRIPKDRS